MARFTAEVADNYGGSGGADFFALKNDKDMATVRFMYNTLDDVVGYAVHEAEVDGKRRYVDCLRAYDDPISACPFCEAQMKVIAKVFIPLYDEDSQEVKLWDRGKTFFAKLESLTNRYNPLVSTPFEIERNGKKGDTNTTYETFALASDDTTLEDLPEIPEILGGLVLDKSYAEMNHYLDYGQFPEMEQADNRDVQRQPNRRQSEAPVQRRQTPATRPARQEAQREPREESPREESPRGRTTRSRLSRTDNTDKF